MVTRGLAARCPELAERLRAEQARVAQLVVRRNGIICRDRTTALITIAVEVISPFVGGEISDADLGRMANEAYATFRHPAVIPLDQIGPNQFLLELFHGPTLAFKYVAMQLISRLMDHVLAQRAQRTTVVVATSGDTGGAAVEAFAWLDRYQPVARVGRSILLYNIPGTVE